MVEFSGSFGELREIGVKKFVYLELFWIFI